jgi:hypothetical protein
LLLVVEAVGIPQVVILVVAVVVQGVYLQDMQA